MTGASRKILGNLPSAVVRRRASLKARIARNGRVSGCWPCIEKRIGSACLCGLPRGLKRWLDVVMDFQLLRSLVVASGTSELCFDPRVGKLRCVKGQEPQDATSHRQIRTRGLLIARIFLYVDMHIELLVQTTHRTPELRCPTRIFMHVAHDHSKPFQPSTYALDASFPIISKH